MRDGDGYLTKFEQNETPTSPAHNERPKTRASKCRQRVEVVRADADPAARERDLWGVEDARDQQYGADDGADEGAICEEEYVDYVCRNLLLGWLGRLLTVCRFYTLSIILGTVALSYGSVPLYKMVGYFKPPRD